MFGLGEMVSSGINFVGGLFEQNTNQRMAADQRQADERGAERQQEWSAGEAEKARSFSSREASTAREWSERLSGSAHQREVADLRKAGLNPILSGTGGMGSQTPGASLASSSMASAGKAGGSLAAPAPNLGAAINTGREAYLRMQNIKDTNKNIEADTDLKRALRGVANIDYNVRLHDTQKRIEEVNTQRALTRQAEHQASILGNSAKGAELEGNIDQTKYGEMMRFIDRAVKALTGSSSAYRNFQQ